MLDEILKEVVDLSKQRFGDGLRQVWLFGSQVTGNTHEDSDILYANRITRWRRG